jgi:hypothetical protein
VICFRHFWQLKVEGMKKGRMQRVSCWLQNNLHRFPPDLHDQNIHRILILFARSKLSFAEWLLLMHLLKEETKFEAAARMMMMMR